MVLGIVRNVLFHLLHVLTKSSSDRRTDDSRPLAISISPAAVAWQGIRSHMGSARQVAGYRDKCSYAPDFLIVGSVGCKTRLHTPQTDEMPTDLTKRWSEPPTGAQICFR